MAFRQDCGGAGWTFVAVPLAVWEQAEGGGMSVSVVKIEAQPTAEQEAILLAFEEAVGRFCAGQAELRVRLAALPDSDDRGGGPGNP